jgi:hypothetical protein
MYMLCRNVYMMPRRVTKRWTIASARQRLPSLIASAAREPQPVYRRNKLVAAVVSPEVAAGAVKPKRNVSEALADLRRLCAAEAYELPVPGRRDRPNPLRVRAR